MDARAVDRDGLLRMLPFLSKSTLERLMREGSFPKPREFSANDQAWLVGDIEGWLAGLPPKTQSPAPRKDETELYRHFDDEGRLLYVGISLSSIARLCSHMGSSHWSGEISKITIERFLTRADAEIAERAAIKAERPLHNIIHARRDAESC